MVISYPHLLNNYFGRWFANMNLKLLSAFTEEQRVLSPMKALGIIIIYTKLNMYACIIILSACQYKIGNNCGHNYHSIM